MPTSDTQLHEQFRALLPSAQAETCQAIVVFLDIRGFSDFSERGESFNSAIYLSSVYSKILDTYFPDTDFFKPTGDGLMLIRQLPTNRAEVPHAVSAVLGKCVSLVARFGQITAGDYMINFPVPQFLGAGLTRGTATRLVSSGFVLDYTGRCINLAARVTGKARPSGVVFADPHATQLMEPEVAGYFSPDRVRIRGIADESILIYKTATVEITDVDRKPISR